MAALIIILFSFYLNGLNLALHQGVDHWSLISESDSELIPCVSKDDDQWPKISQNKILIYKWYNITEAEIDSKLDFLDYIKTTNVELDNNSIPMVTKDGQLLIVDGFLDLTGYYLCILNYGTSISHLKSRQVRYLITVTKFPRFNLVIKLPIRIFGKIKHFKKLVVKNLKQISKSKLINLEDRLSVNSKDINCDILDINNVTCIVQLVVKYQIEIKKTCNKTCAINNLNSYVKKDINKITKLMFQLNEIKFKLSQFVFDYFVECDLGFEFFQYRCVPCMPGFYRNETSTYCQPCPRNTYQFSFAKSNCFECPENMYTLQDAQGSTSIKQCLHHGFLGNIMDEGKDLYSNVVKFWKNLKQRVLH